MKKIIAICLILSVIAIFISGCEQKDKTTSSVIAVGENNVTTSQTETSSDNSSKSSIDRTSNVSSDISSEESSSSDLSDNAVEFIYKQPVAIEKGETFKGIELTRSDVKCCDVITKTYDDELLEEMDNKIKFSMGISEINSLYPIGYLKKYDEYYRAVYLGKEKFLRLEFYLDGRLRKKGIHQFCANKSEFENLTMESTQADVMIIDNTIGHYTTLIGNHSAVNYESYKSICSWHFTKDGYYIFIDYEKVDYPYDPVKGNYVRKISIEII